MLRSLWIKIPTLVLSVAALLLFDGVLGWALAVAIFSTGTAWLMFMVFHVNSTFWSDTRWQAPTPANKVALTFDDGPDPIFTTQILDVLADKQVRATFFVVGERAQAHPEVLERLDAEGHLVGNHTQTHAVWFHFLLWPPLRRELKACNAVIASILGKQPTLFRSPQGAKNPALGDVLKEMKMTAVGWQVRGLDSMGGDARAIEERIVRGARPGGVIALHDGTGFGGRSDRSATIEALPKIIERLQERGLQFTRLDELLEIEPYVTPVPRQTTNAVGAAL